MQVVNYHMIGDGHVWFTTLNSALSSTDVTWAFFGREIKGGQESLMEGLVSACPCDERDETISYRIGRLGCGGLCASLLATA